jgi:uncharacterized protein (TIGR03437 family)
MKGGFMSSIRLIAFLWPWMMLASPALVFEANRGQMSAEVKFIGRGSGFTMLLTTREAVVLVQGTDEVATMRMRPVGGRAEPAIEGEAKLPGMVHYFAGAQPVIGIPAFGRVRYRNVWPGIDWVFYEHDRTIEYDFVVSVGAKPEAIILEIPDAGDLRVTERGDVEWSSGGMLFRQRRPTLYQTDNGRRKFVSGRYRVERSSRICFDVGSYAKDQPLIIDPVLEFSARMGGSIISSDGFHRGTLSLDEPEATGVDGEGNIYLLIRPRSGALPLIGGLTGQASGAPNTFIVKISKDGQRILYSTYLAADMYPFSRGVAPRSLAVDTAGNAYLLLDVDWTGGFPVTTPLRPRESERGGSFIVKLNPNGDRIVYSSYLPASAGGLALGRDGSIVFAGETTRADYPTRNPIQASLNGQTDGVITKLSPDGASVIYSTFLGGAGRDACGRIVLDATESVYVLCTSTQGFPVTPNAFLNDSPDRSSSLTKLDSTGTRLAYSTYLPATMYLFGGTLVGTLDHTHLAVDANGSAYVAGRSLTPDFPQVNPLPAPYRHQPGQSVFQDKPGVLFRIDPTGSRLLFSNVFPEQGAWIQPLSLLADSDGRVYLGGTTQARPSDRAAFPTKRAFFSQDPTILARFCLPPITPALEGDFADCNAGVVMKIDTGRPEVEWATLTGYGGTDVRGIAKGDDGKLTVAGKTRLGVPPMGSPMTTGTVYAMRMREGEDLPEFGTLSIVNAATFDPYIWPGSLATIFGSRLSDVTGIRKAEGLPLPTEIEGTSVVVDGQPTPLLSVSNVAGQEQINFVMPARQTIWVEVRRGGKTGYAAGSAGIRGAFFQDSEGRAIAQHGEDYSLVTGENPARRGEVVVLYGTGWGDVEPPAVMGQPAPARPLSHVAISYDFRASIDGRDAEVLFAGLTPGQIGLYQLNVRVPEETSPGLVEVVFGRGSSLAGGRAVKLPVR